MRTSRLICAASLLFALALLAAAPAAPAAQVERCPEQQLGPASACLAPGDGVSVTTPTTDGSEADAGPALWIGAVFGVAGLAGIVFATARVGDAEPLPS